MPAALPKNGSSSVTRKVREAVSERQMHAESRRSTVSHNPAPNPALDSGCIKAPPAGENVLRRVAVGDMGGETKSKRASLGVGWRRFSSSAKHLVESPHVKQQRLQQRLSEAEPSTVHLDKGEALKAAARPDTPLESAPSPTDTNPEMSADDSRPPSFEHMQTGGEASPAVAEAAHEADAARSSREASPMAMSPPERLNHSAAAPCQPFSRCLNKFS